MAESSYRLSEIWIYPVKSLGGIRVKSSRVFEKGLEFDRRFMLIDKEGVAMTQRDYPKMSLFKTAIKGDQLVVRFEHDSVSIPLRPASFFRQTNAKVWDDEVETQEILNEYSQWFSTRLATDCRLVFFPEQNKREVDPNYRLNHENVSLADAYPLLIIGEKSLQDLNQRLSTPVPMNRFRPNLVFEGGDPFAEDEWRKFSIGENRFAAVKPCARCVLTTVNQDTGVRGTEPLKTLASYRTRNNKVYFGQNVVVISGNEIKEGDMLTPDHE